LNSGGYAWWYLDALSDDRRWSLCVIAFLGSVFSPYYAAARRRGLTDPLNHCAFNVSLTGPATRWCMTERPRRSLELDPHRLSIGASSFSRNGAGYDLRIAERCCPLPQQLRGTVRLAPQSPPHETFALDRAGHHSWTPLAAQARIEVDFDEPAVHWSGEAYLDSNRGDRPLEQDFSGWQWSRCTSAAGTTVFYDPSHRHDAAWPLAVQLTPGGKAQAMRAPGWVALPNSRWGIARAARSEDARATRVLRTWVDAPFYARSHLQTQLAGCRLDTVHESLNLNRFGSRWVQWLLPFRMPRRAAQRTAPSPTTLS
jgi:carotenoid 1,2-hydratase